MSWPLSTYSLCLCFVLSCASPANLTDAGPPQADAMAVVTDGGLNGVDGGGELPTRDDAMAELRSAVLRLDQGWRFRVDPDNLGSDLGWSDSAFDDSDWQSIAVDRAWETQGHPGYDGTGWYRIAVDIPQQWAGSKVTFMASGVDDEYDLFINGNAVAHYGSPPDRSVWGWQTRTRVDSQLRYGERNIIAIRVVDWGGSGGVWRAVALRRSIAIDRYAHLLPRPIVDDKPAWVGMYWAAWQMAFDKIVFGDTANGLADGFIDEGFNEQIYQWDSSFMALFARYGARLFPAMAALDNFYVKQRDDGYIQRVYSETNGQELGEPTIDEPMVNPPLFAWVEWEYARTTGDVSRLSRVFPLLERYYEWLKQNVRDDLGLGLYYQTELGSGMDNIPRRDSHRGGWVDMSAQQALAASHLARIAGVLGDAAAQLRWQDEHAVVAAAINQYAWNDAEDTYYDIQRDGTHTGVRHLGAYWTLLADVVSPQRAERLVQHLTDPAHFYRSHLFPALSAADPNYSANGNYWRGGVWAPTNYMVIRGLARQGFSALARSAAENHIDNMAVSLASAPLSEQIAPEEADGDYLTIWECYAPDRIGPATRWDDHFMSRQDFVGWSGLGPIALLIEEAIGIDVQGMANRVVWQLRRPGRHGVERLSVGDNIVDLVADAAGSTGRIVHVTARSPFELEVRASDGRSVTYAIAAGDTDLAIDW